MNRAFTKSLSCAAFAGVLASSLAAVESSMRAQEGQALPLQAGVAPVSAVPAGGVGRQ
ncbi:MAG TPA: hypothetical protein VKB50_17705 [Vicinamibacterales bacterium]|nr:hypothetical protein [Vicinamibacterales bacterium]